MSSMSSAASDGSPPMAMRRVEMLFSSAKVAWSVAACVLAVLVSREMAGHCEVQMCTLSREEMRLGEAAASREAQVLQQNAARLTQGMNSVLPQMPLEMEKVKSLTKELKAAKKSFEAAEQRIVEADGDSAEAALREAAMAAAEAREAATEVRRNLKEKHESAALLARVEELEEKVREASAAAAVAVETLKKETTKSISVKIDDLVHEAAEEAKRSVESFFQSQEFTRSANDVNDESPTSSKYSRDCVDSELTRLAMGAARQYLDGSGKYDYALGSAGGRVLRKLTSPPYTPPSSRVPTSVYHALGRDAGVGRPEDAISQRNSFGDCFPFAGSHGLLTLKLAAKIKPTSFSLEHIHSSLCNPVHNTNCSSAPKHFRVFGRTDIDDDLGTLLGNFQYDANAQKPTLQTFQAIELTKLFDLISLEVLSNHGHPDYTCIYRFRVHGDPPPPSSEETKTEGDI